MTSKPLEDKKLIELAYFLKISSSIKVELIPANDMFLDKKGFKWAIKRYDEDGMAFMVTFDHPYYISVGGTDTLKM